MTVMKTMAGMRGRTIMPAMVQQHSKEVVAMAYFVIMHEAVHPDHPPDGWRLCLQFGRMEFGTPSEPPQHRYRFIWRRDDGTQMARGAALIVSRKDVETLWAIADRESWGDFNEDAEPPRLPKVA